MYLTVCFYILSELVLLLSANAGGVDLILCKIRRGRRRIILDANLLILHLLAQNELVGTRHDKSLTYHVAKLLKAEFLILASCFLGRSSVS